MTEPRQLAEQIKVHINDNDFLIPYESGSESVFCRKQIGGILIEFTMEYYETITGAIQMDYDQPEECSQIFTPTKIDDVYFYVNGHTLDLDEETQEDLINHLSDKLI